MAETILSLSQKRANQFFSHFLILILKDGDSENVLFGSNFDAES
jgi:hypothetical protein